MLHPNAARARSEPSAGGVALPAPGGLIGRREFLAAVGAGTFCPQIATGQAAAIPRRRTFHLFSPSPQAGLQAVAAAGGSIYFLHWTKVEGSFSYRFGCATPSGLIQWEWPLPEGIYTAFAASPAGSFLFQSLHGPNNLHEFDRTGRLLRQATIPDGPPFRCFFEDTMVRLLPGGAVESLHLDRWPPRSVRYERVVPANRQCLIEHVDGARFMFLDEESPAIVVLDLASGSRYEGVIDAAELQLSAAENARERESAARQGIPLKPATIVATGTNHQGRVYVFLSPYRPDYGLIVELLESGEAARQIYCALPDHRPGRHPLPFKLIPIESELLLVLSGGEVACFSTG